MRDVVVIGGGIFGSTIAAELRSRGADVELLDDGRPNSGSRASAGLIRPGWMFGSEAIYGPALELLDAHFGHQDLEFDLLSGKLGTIEVHFVDPLRAMGMVQRTFARARAIKHFGGARGYEVDLGPEREPLEAESVVVATGAWVPELLGEAVPVVAKGGFGWRFEGQIDRPFSKGWAPYKKILAFNQTPSTVWVGDGSAILHDNWTEKREQETQRRCAEAIGRAPGEGARLYGLRPMVKGAKPCYVERLRTGLWCATGGGKTGMIGAAFAARRIAEGLAG